MPLIRVSHAARLDAETKERMLREVTEAYARSTGSDASKVWVILDEVERTDWATSGISLAARDAATKS